MNNVDQAALLNAIEDYRFSDFEESIKNLGALHKQFPEHQEVLKYLALSYQENGNHQLAISTFNLWLKASKQLLNEESKFAWLGMASSHTQLKNYPAAISNLRTWLKVYPDDLKTQSLLGKTLTQAKEFTASNEVWDSLIQNKSTPTSSKAEAWYYKAWNAFQSRDFDQTREFANQSIVIDAQGSYASAAKSLIAATAEVTGPYAFAAAEVFHHSNVALLPDIIATQEEASDNGWQTNLAFGWKGSKFDVSYAYNATQYKTQTDFDILSHTLSASWLYETWRFTPSFESVSLGKEHLYTGTGIAVYYNHQKNSYHYSIKQKTFNDQYGISATDLSRLGGISHNLGLDMPIDIKGLQTVFSTHLLSEKTKGDSTHDQTDDYLQLGVGLTTGFVIAKDVKLNAGLQLNQRNYAKADTNILVDPASGTKRSDLLTQLSINTNWTPWKNKKIAVSLNLSYTKNSSNYDAGTVNELAIKSYVGWKAGLQLSSQW